MPARRLPSCLFLASAQGILQEVPIDSRTLGELTMCQEASMTTIILLQAQRRHRIQADDSEHRQNQSRGDGLLSCRKLLWCLQRSSDRGKPGGGLLGRAFACFSSGRPGEPQEAPATHTELLWLMSCPQRISMVPMFQSLPSRCQSTTCRKWIVSPQVRGCGWVPWSADGEKGFRCNPLHM